jgi:hypothetical protein
MLCTCSSHCPLSGFHDAGCCNRRTCGCWCHEKSEHRGSRPSVDPLFLDAVFKEFAPSEETIKEKEGK